MAGRAESKIPRLAGALGAERLRTLPLSPSDGYLLSRIDGTSSVEELAEAMGLELDDVIVSIIKLESLGLVTMPQGEKRDARDKIDSGARRDAEARAHAPKSPPPRTPVPARLAREEADEDARVATRSDERASGKHPSADPPPRIEARAPERAPGPKPARRASMRTAAVRPEKRATEKPPAQAAPTVKPPARQLAEKPASARPPAPPPPAPDAKDSEMLDIELAHQEQIETLFAKLGEVDHYALLGIDSAADKKEIKRAYFELTGRYHPDRFFRKKLGPFKVKMEAIFVRMTEAHDTLTRDQRRAEYDAYLGSIDESRLIEQMVAAAMNEVRKAEDAVRVAVPAPPPTGPLPIEPPSQPRIRSVSSVPPTVPSTGAFASEPTTSTRSFPAEMKTGNIRISVNDAMAEARKDMLARRLTGRPARPNTPVHEPVVPPAATKPAEAVDALKRRYEDTVTAARVSQSKKYMASGLEAKARGDMLAAANALRVALSFDGGNAELKAAYDEAQHASDCLLAEQYAKQGDYEEKAEKWAEAARSWRRVARARHDDVKAHERAAYCLLKASGDLHEASALAQRAAQLAPKDLQARLTLANVYLAAGLSKNARRELEAAAGIAPDDPTVATLLKRLGKTS